MLIYMQIVFANLAFKWKKKKIWKFIIFLINFYFKKIKYSISILSRKEYVGLLFGTFGPLCAFQKSVLIEVNKMGFHHLLSVYNGVLKR